MSLNNKFARAQSNLALRMLANSNENKGLQEAVQTTTTTKDSNNYTNDEFNTNDSNNGELYFTGGDI